MQDWGLWAGLLLALGLVVGGIVIYNRLIFNRVRVAEAWSGIDVQLKRRADLIPVLVECVRHYIKHENSTLTAVVAARSRALELEGAAPPQRAPVESSLGSDLRNLLVLVEAYPELKADEQFRSLHHNLVEVEDQIQMARRYYNGAVRELNVLVESVPSNLVAKVFAFKQAEFFSLSDPAQAATPKVEV
jgi:LemA protein